MKICFMGTPAFGAVSLQALLDRGYDVAAVFTQPDKPKGRGNKIVMSPVKELALKYQIPVYQPEKISRDCVEILEAIQPDACVTAAYGQFLSEKLLSIPKLGTVNVHASLLPKHRGSAPINWSIILGDQTTGVTTMMTVKKMDAGDILLQESLLIDEKETAGELTERLAHAGGSLLVRTLEMLEAGTCPRTPQDEEQMTYEPMLQKETGRIDWTKTAKEADQLIRGVTPAPGAFMVIGDNVFKVFSAAVRNELSGDSGSILVQDAKKGLIIACREGALEILELQPQNGKRMPAKSYLLGHKIEMDKVNL